MAGETDKRQQERRTPIYTIIVAVYWILAKVCFFIRFEGTENIPKNRPCILMGNHQCLLDPITLALCARDREIRFMGKKELFEIPVLGRIFALAHGFPVDRGNMDMAAMRTALSVIQEGHTLGIFPEGTRSRGPQMRPLLGGASLIALRSGCPVIPVYIDGNYRLFRPIRVRIGSPVETEDILRARINKDACEKLTGRMEESFAQLSGGRSRSGEKKQLN